MIARKLTPEMKAAVLKNHGGHAGASDQQLLTIWNSLPEANQAKYLAPPAPVTKPATKAAAKPAE